MLTPAAMLAIKKRGAQTVRMALAGLGVALWSGCAQPGPRALFEGERLIRKGEYGKAVERLQQATRLLPGNAQAWNHLGLAHHHAGQPKEAIQAYRRALEKDRNLAVARYNLGCLFLEQGDQATAADELTIYASLQPKVLDGWLKLGAAQLHSRRLDLAEKSFNEALRLQPQHPEALNGLGLVQYHRSRAREATHYFLAALKRDPNHRPALFNLAVAYQQSQTTRQLALQRYREYLALQPRPVNWESTSAAARQLDLELNPPRLAPSNQVAQAALSTNAGPGTSPGVTRGTTRTNSPAATSPPTVRAEIKTNTPRVTVVPPSPPPVEVVRLPEPPVTRPAQDVVVPPPTIVSHTNAADSAVNSLPAAPVSSGDVAKADKPGFFSRLNPVNWFKGRPASPAGPGAAKPLPTDPAGGSGTVATVPRAGHMEPITPLPAVAPVFRYKYLSPARPAAGNRRSAEAAFAPGLQAHQERRWADAVAAYRTATQSDPSFYEAHYNLGLAAYEAGDVPTALAAYERALAIRPDSLNARYNFALALKRANHGMDAAHELEKLLLAYPDETRAHLQLANLYAQQLFQTQLAREHYLKVLELEPRHPQSTSIRYWLAANP